MKYQFICYSKCSTCAKAKKWLEENNIEFEERSITENSPTKEELREWILKSGHMIKKFFNTSGKMYRDLNLKDGLKIMTGEEQVNLLAKDPMLIKRPILVGEDIILVGFKEEEWKKIL